jgi:tRNA-dihydrouridine synthase
MNAFEDLDNLPRPFFVLAPMDDVTDSVFRRVVEHCAAPDLYFTEFVNVDGLQSPGRVNLMKKLQYEAEEQPLIAQIWGMNPENYRKTADELVAMGFAGIDINMGCPAKSEVRAGACSALINNRELAIEIIQATQEGAAGRVPVSVKTRLGWNEVDFTWHELLLQQNLNMLTIHGRTKKEMSKVPAHWKDIETIRELRDTMKVNTLIVGNGDVISRQHGEALAQEHKLDGVMVGRGIFHDPYLFAQTSPWSDKTIADRIDLFRWHVQLFADTWQEGQRPIHTLNKFCKVYIQGFDGAKDMREQFMNTTSAAQLLRTIQLHQSQV